MGTGQVRTHCDILLLLRHTRGNGQKGFVGLCEI